MKKNALVYGSANGPIFDEIQYGLNLQRYSGAEVANPYDVVVVSVSVASATIPDEKRVPSTTITSVTTRAMKRIWISLNG